MLFNEEIEEKDHNNNENKIEKKERKRAILKEKFFQVSEEKKKRDPDIERKIHIWSIFEEEFKYAREEYRKCVYKERVNHFTKCKELREEYFFYLNKLLLRGSDITKKN